MERETTGVMFSYYNKSKRTRASDFHQSCVPAQSRVQAVQAGDSKYKESDFMKCDAVTQDTIWKQAVEVEKRTTQQWEENWGFLAQYDPKGRPISPKELPAEVNMFSENVPNTNAGNYGGRLNTDTAQTIQSLEFRFNSHNRKKKMGDDLVCY